MSDDDCDLDRYGPALVRLRTALAQAEAREAEAKADASAARASIVRLVEKNEELRAALSTARAEADAMREALETSSEMMKAMAQQLASWGHETVVNYRGQLAKNAALRFGRPQGEK